MMNVLEFEMMNHTNKIYYVEKFHDFDGFIKVCGEYSTYDEAMDAYNEFCENEYSNDTFFAITTDSIDENGNEFAETLYI